LHCYDGYKNNNIKMAEKRIHIEISVNSWYQPMIVPKSHKAYFQRGPFCYENLIFFYINTYAISAYHHWCCEFESRSGRGVHKIVRHNITEILVKVALNTINQTNNII
jgi:hypothetical protein